MENNNNRTYTQHWKLAVSAILISITFNSHAQYSFLGGGIALDDYCIELTPNLNDQSGWAFSTEKFKLDQKDSLEFNLFIGNADAGADGMTFILHNDPRGYNAQGCVGEALGYGDHPSGPLSAPCGFGTRSAITPSVAVEFDTYRNGGQGDPFADHLAYLENGDVNHGSSFVSVPNIEDNTTHHFKFLWDPTINQLDIFFDGSILITVNKDIQTLIFGGATDAYWGFAASTGGSTNQHYFCSIDEPSTIGGNWTNQSGDISDINTWINGLPVISDCNLTILDEHTLTVDQDYNIGGLTISNGGNLDLSGNTLTIESCDLINNGNIVPNGGEILFSGTSQNLVMNREDTLHDIRLDRNTELSVTNGRLNLSGSLEFERRSTLNTNNQLRLISDLFETGRIGLLRGSVTINGDVEIQRYIYATKRIWRYLASPVSNSSVLDWQGEIPISGTFTSPSTGVTGEGGIDIVSGSPSLYYYSESTPGERLEGYQNYPASGSSANAPLVPGTGYAIFVRDNASRPNAVDVSGTISRGNFTVPTTYTDNGTPAEDGWNLIGNPYPSQIDWTAIPANRRTNLDNAIYFTDNDEPVTVFRSFVNGIGNPFGTTGIISSSQAFWVKANAPNPRLRLRENYKVNTTSTFHKKSSPKNVIRMKLNGTDINEDQAVVYLIDSASKSFDKQYDAYKQHTGEFNISTVTSDGKELSINGFNLNNNTKDTINIHFNQPSNGEYSLTFFNQESVQPGITVYLYDNYLDSIFDVSNIEYQFSISSNYKSKSNDRFSLIFNKKEKTVVTNINDDNISTSENSLSVYPNPAYGNQVNLRIEIVDNHPIQITVIDITGSVIATKNITSFKGVGEITEGTLDISTFKSGVYSLRISSNNWSSTKKLVVKH